MFGQKISQDEFESLKERYQKKNPGKTRSVIFDREVFERLLSHKTDHIVVFFGETEDNATTVMLSAVDKDKKVIYTENRGGPCPPYC
jgi:hypothetical protein